MIIMFIKCVLIHIFETKYTEYIRFVLNEEEKNGKETMCIKNFCKNTYISHVCILYYAICEYIPAEY